MDHSLLHLPSSDKIISSITQCRNPEEKYGLLDKLLSQLVYTNVNQAVKYIEKLKNSVSANLIGRTEPDVTVVFSGGTPTTEDINVTFIKHKK